MSGVLKIAFCKGLIIHACTHFKLGYIKNEYVLVIDVDGDEVAVTDDILKQFKKKEKTLTLVRSYSEDLRPSFDDDGVDRDRCIMLHTICQALAKKRTPVRVALSPCVIVSLVDWFY